MTVQDRSAHTAGCAVDTPPPTPVPDDWRPALPFAALGASYVVLGGLVAAVGYSADWDRAAWASAFLVLVGGVAQVVLGGGAVALAAAQPPRKGFLLRIALWNIGTLVVLAGGLAEQVVVVAIGGLVLLGGLVVSLKSARCGGRRVHARWAQLGYDGFVVFLLASIGVGVALTAA